VLEKQVWRDFAAVTFSVAVLGIGLGSTLPLTALILSARGIGPEVIGWMVAASALGGIAGTLAAPAATIRYGRARVQLICGGLMCLLLPLLPIMLRANLVWAVYLYVLGGVAGAVYTLSLVASGEHFSGAALLRTSGLIALTWNIAGTVGPIVTGVAMQFIGNAAIAAVLWVLALAFFAALLRFGR
jgi:MFS family permease